jgi:hypothetical protein
MKGETLRGSALLRAVTIAASTLSRAGLRPSRGILGECEGSAEEKGLVGDYFMFHICLAISHPPDACR